jgi:hypothetical protein
VDLVQAEERSRRMRLRPHPYEFCLYYDINAAMDVATSETLAKLAQFDTPTICNVIELFDIARGMRGYMDGRIRANFP